MSMLRRPSVSVPLTVQARMSSIKSKGTTPLTPFSQEYTKPINDATGPDNKPGVYGEPRKPAYFEAQYENKHKPNIKSDFEPPERSDNIKYPEYDLLQGQYENVPPHVSGGPGVMRENKYTSPNLEETVEYGDVLPQPPIVGHSDTFDYVNRTGKREGNLTPMAGSVANYHIKSAIFSLYRCVLRGVPLTKHIYWLTMPVDKMMKKVRQRFEINKYVRDPDAIRHLISTGWSEYFDTMSTRRTRSSVLKYFDDYDDRDVLRKQYTEEEGQLLEERRFWNGEEQRREGPYEGHWSQLGLETAREFEKIAGRIPKSWTTSKGYFETKAPDGTNYWEKNLDYEGWYLKNVDPDDANARREAQGWIESGYNQPKHYASKNRRAYRRFVKDIEGVMESSVEEIYSRNRELFFQNAMREKQPEANRVYAEKQLALQDDDVYSTNWSEVEVKMKQVMREMPNPRMWASDAFYLRYKYLSADLEYNWARVPVGAEQDKLYSLWISDDVNYAITNSKLFASIKTDKTRNPMAATWGDFYSTFDPDVPETRSLPWFHADFDYDRRHKWDERCMRKKKWVDSGDVDSKHSFFDSYIAEYQQYVNRGELSDEVPYSMEKRYVAPRMVQLYRNLNRIIDVALATQIKAAVEPKLKGTPADKLQSAVDSADLKDFKFIVPALIYPDNAPRTKLGLDGKP